MTPSDFHPLGTEPSTRSPTATSASSPSLVLSRSGPGGLVRAPPDRAPEQEVGAGGGWDAALFELRVRENPRFEFRVERALALVCFGKRGSDEENRAIASTSRGSSSGCTVLPGSSFTLRLAVGSSTTEKRHVRAAQDVLRGRGAAGKARELAHRGGPRDALAQRLLFTGIGEPRQPWRA